MPITNHTSYNTGVAPAHITDYNTPYTVQENYENVFYHFEQDCRQVARHLLLLNNPGDIFERLEALYLATIDTDYETVQESYTVLNAIIAETNDIPFLNNLNRLRRD